MRRKLEISREAFLDPAKLVDSRMLINANSGGGKSYLLRVLAEQAAGQIQTIILDHEGEFSTLREKFDFILAGPGGEIPVEVKSSALLARKLLELQASAVVDMSSLKLPERRRFVRLFIESLMSAPKSLWHPLLMIIDEAHIYCPERSAGEAESTQAIIDLMSMGRKRSFCGVLATQRLSKLHKDAEAEANNVMIGRTWLDIDQKRAAGLLGFGKEKNQELRDMPQGCFFCFGPALSNTGVSLIKVAESQTTHPKPGHRHNFTPPRPSDAVKRIVKDLADLPQQADAEIRDLNDAKRKIAELEASLRKVPAPAAPPVSKADTDKELSLAFQRGELKGASDQTKHLRQVMGSVLKQARGQLQSVTSHLEKLTNSATSGLTFVESAMGFVGAIKLDKPATPPLIPDRRGDAIIGGAITGRFSSPVNPVREVDPDGKIPDGERKLMVVMAMFKGATVEQLTVMTGYKRSSRNTYLQRLRGKGLVTEEQGKFVLTHEGVMALGDTYEPLPTGEALQEYWLKRLPEGEAKILRVLVENHPYAVSKEKIGELTGYMRSSRNTYIQRMRAKLLFTEQGEELRANDNLFG